jgi:formylglycine-generating enzyme required for sulfatase activity
MDSPSSVTPGGASPPSRDVFISYSSADQSCADLICKAFALAGISFWIADRDVEAGTSFPGAILQAIGSAKAVVLVLSQHSVASRHVLSEIAHAFNSQKPIIPFRLSDVALPPNFDYFLSLSQWLDVRQGCTEENLVRLVEATRGVLAGRAAPQPTKQRRFSKWLLASLLVILLVSVIFISISQLKPPQKSVRELKPQPEKHAEALSRPPAKTWLNPKDGQAYAWIPPGTFTMGCSAGDSECNNDEKPSHPVEISKGFWLARTELAGAAFRRSGVKLSQGPKILGDTIPVTGVSWSDAKAYCTAVAGRLPTEAEWEYAARAGANISESGPLSKIAWYAADSGDEPHPVGTKQPNGFGVYDMLGNVSEWVLDRYFNKYYLDSPATGPEVTQPLQPNASAVGRGGYWNSEAVELRLSRRFELPSDEPVPFAGIRCASDHRGG